MQQVEIIGQHPQAVGDVCPLLVCQAALGRRQGNGVGGRLSQLSRAVEKQGNNSSHRPQLSDLRDSGSIEQDADCVLFLYRDSYYASQNPDGAEVDADTAECIVAKNRHGETSTVPLGWDGAHTRFMDVDFKR